MKQLSYIVIAVIAMFGITACGAKEEPADNIPTGQPGDGGPQPTSVSTPGGETAPEAGGTMAPVTE